MSDFLNRLASRSLGIAQVAQPIVPSRVFAMPGPVRSDPGGEGVGEVGEGMALGSFEPAAERQGNAKPVRQRVSSEGQIHAPATPAVPAMFAEPALGRIAPAGPSRDSAAEPVRRAPAGNSESTDDEGAVPDPESAIPLAVGLHQPRQVIQAAERRPNPERVEPVIRVTIGRVDIRAEFPAPVMRQSPPPRSKPSALSLDEYLKQRSEGRR